MLVEASEHDSGDLWAEALERGRIVRFARPPIELPAREELDFLRQGLAPFLERKNVSYYPEAERLTGLRGPPEVRRRAQAILRQHSKRVRGFLERAMRRFHNWMKDTPSFQRSEEGLREISFAPFQAWMVLTDGVSHACIRGQHALVDTFLVPLANCRVPAEAPYRILAGARS